MGSTIQKSGKCGQTAGPIGNQFCTCNWPHETPRGHFDVGVGAMFWVLRGSTFHQKSGECHDIQRKQIFLNV